MLLASVIGGYTLIGGLGATFYVSYFNTALIFVLILMLVVEVFYNPFNNPENPFGGAGILYDYISCWKAPNGNRDESYLTFYSPGNYLATLFKNGINFHSFSKKYIQRWPRFWHCQHCRKFWHCVLWSSILAKFCGCQTFAGMNTFFSNSVLPTLSIYFSIILFRVFGDSSWEA